MKSLVTTAFAFAAAALSAHAEPVVVEIFASQNCAACPKAFSNLNEISETEDLLVLTWSVDYWDYLATADPMAMPESKDRQSDYVERFELRGPYTPQAVFDGSDQVAGNRRSRVEKLIAKQKSLPQTVRAQSIDNEKIRITGDAQATASDVLLVHYLSEYQGDMPNPVIKYEQIGEWNGEDITYTLTCSSACAVLVQEKGTGRIHAAATLG